MSSQVAHKLGELVAYELGELGVHELEELPYLNSWVRGELGFFS